MISPSDNIVMWKKPFDPKDLHVTFQQKEASIFSKPVGVWYACGSDWIDWVESEMPHWKSTYVYKLDINKRAVLRLNTAKKLFSFTDTFGRMSRQMYPEINWKEVAELYDGIEICPYQHKLRLDPRVNWYYSWDVASGCIWRTSCIKSVATLDES